MHWVHVLLKFPHFPHTTSQCWSSPMCGWRLLTSSMPVFPDTFCQQAQTNGLLQNHVSIYVTICPSINSGLQYLSNALWLVWMNGLQSFKSTFRKRTGHSFLAANAGDMLHPKCNRNFHNGWCLKCSLEPILNGKLEIIGINDYQWADLTGRNIRYPGTPLFIH